MPVSCQVIIDLIEKFAPRRMAEDWDNVGLQVGHPADRVSRVLVTLDLTEAVVQEAVAAGADLIVTHHPLIFRPLKQLRFDLPEGKLLQQLIRHGIAVFAAHTNLDNCDRGVNTVLAERLGLQDVRILTPRQEKLVKVVVFVPWEFEEQVRQAMCVNGAGWIGNYSDCTFALAGKGTFRPLEGTNPFIGKLGELEQVEEIRLETIVREQDLGRVLKAMLKVHPYEEVAYDLYPLLNEGAAYGLGRIGNLPEPVTLEALGKRVAETLGTVPIRLAGDPERNVSRVAVCGGSGGGLVSAAAFAGAEVLVTGDVKHHEALDALGRGLAVIDAGHYGTENPVVPVLAAYLETELRNSGKEVAIMVSQVNTDPFQNNRLQPNHKTGTCAHGSGSHSSRTDSAAATVPETDGKRVNSEMRPKKPDTIYIYTDGASRGNPGPAAIGVVILDEAGAEITAFGEYLGETTNNIAEYTALIRGLEEGLVCQAGQAVVRMDSELAVKQLNGEYQVRNPGLQHLHRKARELLEKYQNIRVEHIPREMNKRADNLANEALDR